MTTEIQRRALVRPVASDDQYRAALAQLSEKLSRCARVTRTRSHIQREYNLEKYGTLLAASPRTMADAIAFEGQGFSGRDEVVLYRGQLCLAQQEHIQEMLWHWIDRILELRFAAARADWICELGCGFGHHLSRCGLPSYGGELTQNGVRLANSLGQDVTAFDFYDPESYRFIRPRSIIFTCHAIEQLPSAKTVLENLWLHRHNIVSVVHFEPLVLARDSELGALQERYLDLNHYNRDLHDMITNSPNIEVLHSEIDLIGGNPLNPASLLQWRFKSQ
jgi:hypothetical protein